jgi:hypothetical protein
MDMGTLRISATTAGLAALVIFAPGGPALAPPARAQAAAPQPDYHPSMADLMTMAVQPRHTKLGLAGRARNWSYAAYEVSELKNAFARIARTVPVFNGNDTAALFSARIRPPLDELDAAIKARDGRRFDAAYADVTDACNVCHRALSHDPIVIKVPDGAAFPDQDFRPRAGR